MQQQPCHYGALNYQLNKNLIRVAEIIKQIEIFDVANLARAYKNRNNRNLTILGLHFSYALNFHC